MKSQIWPIARLVLLVIALIGLPACGATTRTTPTVTPPRPTPPPNTSSATSESVNGLMLSLSLNSTIFQPGQEISVVIDEWNTLATANKVSASNSWPLRGLSVGPCGTLNYPFGVAIFQGNYTSSNVPSATPLQLWLPVPCPIDFPVGYYSFDPLSDTASVFCITAGGFGGGEPNPCLTDFKVSSEITVTGYWTWNNGQQPTSGNFTPGVYTVVGGDEWGALAALHFVVQGDDESTPLT